MFLYCTQCPIETVKCKVQSTDMQCRIKVLIPEPPLLLLLYPTIRGVALMNGQYQKISTPSVPFPNLPESHIFCIHLALPHSALPLIFLAKPLALFHPNPLALEPVVTMRYVFQHTDTQVTLPVTGRKTLKLHSQWLGDRHSSYTRSDWETDTQVTLSVAGRQTLKLHFKWLGDKHSGYTFSDWETDTQVTLPVAGRQTLKLHSQ